MACPFCGARVEVRVERVKGGDRALELRPVVRALGRPRARGAGPAVETVEEEALRPSLAVEAERETRAALAEARARALVEAGALERRADSGPRLTPWETPGRGLFERYVATVRGVVGAPATFFGRLSADRIGRAPAFALAVMVPGSSVQALSLYHVLEWLGWPAGVAAPSPWLMVALGNAAGLLLLVYLAFAYQLGARALSRRRPKLAGTVRATCFGAAPMVLALLPGLGLLLGAAWMLALHRVGLRCVFGLGRGAALVVSLLPWAALLAGPFVGRALLALSGAGG
jgi:hypothetical protein